MKSKDIKLCIGLCNMFKNALLGIGNQIKTPELIDEYRDIIIHYTGHIFDADKFNTFYSDKIMDQYYVMVLGDYGRSMIAQFIDAVVYDSDVTIIVVNTSNDDALAFAYYLTRCMLTNMYNKYYDDQMTACTILYIAAKVFKYNHIDEDNHPTLQLVDKNYKQDIAVANRLLDVLGDGPIGTAAVCRQIEYVKSKENK